jgi:hypothetical protein
MKKILLATLVCLSLINFKAKAQLTLTTDSILQLSTCAGGNIIVPYTVSGGSYQFGNTFTAQLSNAFGQFTNPVNIGSLFFWNSGIILATIPANTNFGFFYKIRVIASNPADTGAACPNTLIITQVAQLNQILPFPSDTVCNDTTTLTAINFASSYAWSTGDTTMSINVTAPGIYTVTTTDILGCQSTTSDTVILYCLGVEENDLQNAIDIYPNPSNGIVNIKWNASGTQKLKLSVFNSIGQEVIRSDNFGINSAAEKQIDINGFSPGIYFITFQNENGRTTKKIIIQ